MRSPALLATALLALLANPSDAQPSPGGRVNQLKVLSDQVDDISTVDNLLKSFVKPGMTDQERSEALWRAVVKYRHQTIPPDERIGDLHAHDPIKLLNVYGYCQCCCTSALIEALNRADGREARGRILNGHSVPEVRYGDAWHMFDPALIAYFPRPDDGKVASVDEIAGSVADWYASHPGYRKNPVRIDELMRKDGWTGWKSGGPRLLAHCPFYRMGYLPSGTHGWDATMAEYDRKSEVYEYGYHVGHKALFSVRPGESFVREAGNRGLHVNKDVLADWDGLTARVPENDLRYVPEYLPGYRGGVVGNGLHRYAPNLGAGDLALGAEVFDNLESSRDPERPGLGPRREGRPGVVVIPMTSPYVYLDAGLRYKATVGRGPHRIAASLSTNGGRSYTEAVSTEGPAGFPGSKAADWALGRYVLRRYAYWLRLELTGDVVLESIELNSNFQHAPRTLPRLAGGRTTITVAADGDPTIATRSIAPRITPDPAFKDNESSTSLGLTFDNLSLEHDACWWKGGTGTLTVPIETPGDLVSVGFSALYRARGQRDRIRVASSADDGRTWREVAVLAGPTQGKTEYHRVGGWPPKTRKALLRFALTGDNTVGVQALRVDADYRDPLASPAFRPFRVVHRWTESGRPRSHAETIERLPTSYAIEAEGEPEMVSVGAEMAPGR